jgi:hypothetical protein
MIVSDIMSRVKRQFGDESGVQVTDADIIRWINDGMRHIVMQNEGLLEITATSNVVANQQEYSFPANLLIFKSLSYKGEGQDSYFPLKGMGFPEFNSHIQGWDGTAYGTSPPCVYTVFAGQIRVFPIPDVSITEGFKLFYNRVPTDIAAGSDTPELPVLYHPTIVDYCLKQAYEMDEDFEASGAKMEEVISSIQILRGRDDGWKSQEIYPHITVSPDDL